MSRSRLHSPGCCSRLCLGLCSCHTPQSGCGSVGKRRISICTCLHVCAPPFRYNGCLWLLSQMKQQSQISSSPQQKRHRQQFKASTPWLVTDLPHDTRCATSHHFPCPSFYHKRPTNTTDAGPMAQHMFVQPRSWGMLLPSATVL